MKKPNIILTFILGGLLKIFSLFKGQRIVKKCTIKGPAIVLTNHTSFFDFVYTSAALYPRRVTYLAAKKMFYEKGLGFFLKLARAIPKSLMQADPIATMNAFRILKKNGIISIFPEGQISPSGRSLKPAFSIAKFLKKAKVDVYIVKHYGAGLVNPPWSKKTFKGRIESVKELIITKEKLSELSVDDIYSIVCDKLYYSPSEDNKIKRYSYKLNDISNLENVIYQCPNCLHEGLEVRHNELICPHCQNRLVYDEYGLVNNEGLDELFAKQEARVRKQIDDFPNYLFSGSTRVMSFRNNELVFVGQGVLTISQGEYIYEGTVDSEPTRLTFNAVNIPSLPSDIGRNIQIYDGNQIYQFEMDNKWLPTKMVHVGEYQYELSQIKSKL
jgi:1-acyl-sn-glycerol-3-phosphate acyltransferase